LRVTPIQSCLKFCLVLNGKVRLKQELLEYFELIARIREERGKKAWSWDAKHHAQYTNLQEAHDWFEQIAIIWDYARKQSEVKSRALIDLQTKLESVWNAKFPGNGTELEFSPSMKMEA